jgi:hypothetical protein
MVLILAATLAAQSSPSSNEAARGDLEFARGVEEFVIAAAPGGSPPEPYRGLIDRLGDSSWRERDAASRQLQAASMTDQRWLFWGRRHLDLEVRLRSNAILRRLNPCSTCKGTGQSKNWDAWPCWDCNGHATAWPWSMWD